MPNPIEVMTAYEKNSFTEQSLNDLNDTYRLIDWQDFFTFLFGQKIDKNMLVHVYFEEYFRKVFQNLNQLTPK